MKIKGRSSQLIFLKTGYNIEVMKLVTKNKKAYFDYEILEDWEAGLVLHGSEIKAIRAGRVNMTGSYVKPFAHEGVQELWWVGGSFHLEGDENDTRSRKILIHKAELERILGRLSAGNCTVVPLELYLKRGLAKLKIGLAVKRKLHNKRELLKKRASEREIEKSLKERHGTR